MSVLYRLAMSLVFGVAVFIPTCGFAMTLFQMTNLSQAAKDSLVVHFDATVGVSTVSGFDDVDAWEGRDGNGSLVTTAQFMGPGNFGDVISTGTSVRFAEVAAINTSRLQTTLSTSGNQYTVFWKGFYSSANTNGAASSGLYAYNLTNLGNNAPGLNHQRDDATAGSPFRVEVYPGTTSGGDSIEAYDNTSTVWTTIYNYANSSQSAFANHTDLHLEGAPTLSLTANPTLIIGGFDDGSYFNGSGYNFLGDIEQLIIFDGILSGVDIAEVQEFLGLEFSIPTLKINRQSGAVTLENSSQAQVAISGYSFSTAAGGFDRTNWMPIAGTRDNSLAGNRTVDPDDVWLVEGNSTDPTLAESTTGEAVLNPGQTVSLGNMGVWTPYFDETVVASLTGGSGQPLEILVKFEGGPGVPYKFGDIDFSGGTPDVADWTFLQSVYGSDLSGQTVAQAYGMGDLNGDGVHSLLDLQAFRDAFVAGGGNLASLAGAEVPEPTSFILILLGVMAMLLREISRRANVDAFGKVASWISTRRVWKLTAMCCLLATTLGLFITSTAKAGLFDDAPLSPDGQSKLLIHFDGSVGVDSMGSQVDSWNGYDGTGQNIVATATLAGVGAGTNITTNGTAVIFNETIATETLHLQAPLATSGGQYTIFWKGHYDSTNQNGAQTAGLYAYSLTNLEVASAPGMNHQRDDFGGSYRVEVYPGATFGGDSIVAHDNTSTVWTTIYDYTHSTHRAYANGVDLHLGGSSSLSLLANPTLVIGGYDDGRYPNTSGYNLLGEIEHLIVFEGILSEPDIAAVESFLGPTLPTLTINTSSREMTLTGGENAVNINGYEILSAGDSLNPTPWLANNFDAKNLDPVGAGVGQTWDVFSSSSSQLTEAFLYGSSPFDLNRTVSIGLAYDSTVDARDVIFQYQTTAGVTRYGVVQYVTSEDIPGDFNGDGTVNAADYTLWRDSMGATGAGLPADANLDEIVNQVDYGAWKANFGASFEAANLNSSSAVAEPSTALLLLFAIFLPGLIRRKRHFS